MVVGVAKKCWRWGGKRFLGVRGKIFLVGVEKTILGIGQQIFLGGWGGKNLYGSGGVAKMFGERVAKNCWGGVATSHHCVILTLPDIFPMQAIAKSNEFYHLGSIVLSF